MRPPKTFLVLLLIFGAFQIFEKNHAQATSQTAINPERRQLIEDALYWMTFRENGTLATNQTVNALFLKPILDRYRTSKFYRSFVIAFQHGVLPRLTLSESESCDSKAMEDYRNQWNRTLTWHSLKKLTFDSYSQKDSNSSLEKFCDYRQGLFCKPSETNSSSSTGTCECPQGSTLESIDPIMYPNKTDNLWRCLLNINEICSLIDLHHTDDHSSLASNLHHLIFNLEKPLSCAHGSQCRFKLTDLHHPRCYRNTDLPFHPPNATTTWDLKLGSECALGLYANPGSCQVNTGEFGALPGLICYNFGLPRSDKRNLLPVDHRQGFCFPEYGEYGLASAATSANKQLQFHPLFTRYIHPRNIPLRDDELLDYYLRFINEVHARFFQNGIQKEAAEICHVDSTKMYEDIFWNYFATLSDDPLGFNDFPPNAYKMALETKLEALIEMGKNETNGVCRVYPFFHKSGPNEKRVFYPALNCTEDYPGSEYGRCFDKRLVPVEWAEEFQDFLDETSLVQIAQEREELDYDEIILRDNPESFCKGVGVTRSDHIHEAPLEDGSCPGGGICFTDYGDHLDIYDSGTCDLKQGADLKFSCHEGRDGIEYGKCEVERLDELLEQAIPKVEQASTLGQLDTCQFHEEKVIRKWIGEGMAGETNKFKVLVKLDKMLGGNGRFCDARRLLECKEEGICECVESTAPRIEIDEETGQEEDSDFCYMKTGSCKDRELSTLVALTPNERMEAGEHYGEGETPGDFCGEDANFCVFFLKERGVCKPSAAELDGLVREFAGARGLRGGRWGVNVFLALIIFKIEKFYD